MPSFRSLASIAIVAASLLAPRLARADGFLVERLRLAPAGAGWLALDTLDMHGGLGGAIALTTGYAREPLRVGGVGVVANQAFADVGASVTWDRFRVHAGLTGPLVASGRSTRIGATAITAPDVNLGERPDLFSDVRLGLTARLLGGPTGGFRLGASAELFVPSGDRDDFVTDGTYRGVLASSFAGDVRWLSYAGQVGVHLRARDEAAIPGGPRGSELVFGLAAGARAVVGTTALVIGPELFGQTALREAFGGETTGLEALASMRVEDAVEDGLKLRTRLALGGGLDPNFGAPAFRMVVGVELFGQSRRAPATR
jgi:hypothetical protein